MSEQAKPMESFTLSELLSRFHAIEEEKAELKAQVERVKALFARPLQQGDPIAWIDHLGQRKGHFLRDCRNGYASVRDGACCTSAPISSLRLREPDDGEVVPDWVTHPAWQKPLEANS